MFPVPGFNAGEVPLRNSSLSGNVLEAEALLFSSHSQSFADGRDLRLDKLFLQGLGFGVALGHGS
jgi:hypothetical protein